MQYHRLIPPNSFMGRYLSYMQTQETARAFDFWCSLWCISAACARYTYVDRPRAPVFLNMFTILVGESGIARKTTSVHTAVSVARSIVGTGTDVGLLDAKMTPEKLDELLHNYTMEHGTAQLCIAVPELAVLLGTERYIAHMPVLLTDLYDCPAKRDGGGTLKRGAVVQRNVWISLLSASTPIWLLKTVNPNVIEGGFTSRCYFIIGNEPKKRIPWPIQHDTDLFQDMRDDMTIIRAEAIKHGPIMLSDRALAAFSHWYDNREHSIDPFRQSFEAREDAHVLRIAALLCINDGSWIVDRSHINIAIRLIAGVKSEANNIFENAESRTKFAIALDTVRAMLMSAGMDPIARGILFRRVRGQISNPEFMTLIEVMHEIGAIQRFHIHSGERGRPTEYIRGTNLLLSSGLGQTVLDRFDKM